MFFVFVFKQGQKYPLGLKQRCISILSITIIILSSLHVHIYYVCMTKCFVISPVTELLPWIIKIMTITTYVSIQRTFSQELIILCNYVPHIYIQLIQNTQVPYTYDRVSYTVTTRKIAHIPMCFVQVWSKVSF